MLTRHPSWQNLLRQYVAHTEPLPFARGRLDCVMFALDAVKTITGVDLCPDARDAYDTRAGAVKFLRSRGVDTLQEFAMQGTQKFGLPLIDPELAMPGDLALVKSGDIGHALAIRYVRGFITKAVGQRGLATVDEAVMCWRVG